MQADLLARLDQSIDAATARLAQLMLRRDRLLEVVADAEATLAAEAPSEAFTVGSPGDDPPSTGAPTPPEPDRASTAPPRGNGKAPPKRREAPRSAPKPKPREAPRKRVERHTSLGPVFRKQHPDLAELADRGEISVDAARGRAKRGPPRLRKRRTSASAESASPPLDPEPASRSSAIDPAAAVRACRERWARLAQAARDAPLPPAERDPDAVPRPRQPPIPGVDGPVQPDRVREVALRDERFIDRTELRAALREANP